MAKAKQEYWVSLDLKNNELLNAKVEVVSALPPVGNAGRVIYNSSTGKFCYDNGTKFVEVADASVVATNVTDIGALKTTVGDAEGGLVKRVTDLETTVGAGGEGDSLVDKVDDLTTRLGTIDDTADKPTAFGKAAAASAAASAAKTAADNAKAAADAAQGTADGNTASITALTGRVSTAEGKITTLETNVGGENDTASATGSAFARIAQNKADIGALTTTVSNNNTAVTEALATKVDKVAGKGLSTNDFTNDLKSRLEGIEAGAQVNKVVDVTVDGKSVVGSDKIAKIVLTEYAKKTDIASAYSFEGSVAFKDLPTLSIDDKGKVYNVTDAFKDGDKIYPAGTNVAWTGTAWDPLAGYTDFSVFATNATLTSELAKKQNSLSEAQLAAANSGITATKVGIYDGYDDLITTAQSTADTAKATADKAVVANTAITAGTACKITYDAKGLVTKGENLAATDLPSGIPIAKITGVLPYDQSPIMAAQFDVSADPEVALSIPTGMTQALVAQAVTSAGVVVGCAMQISGANVSLTFNEKFTGKVNVVGLR